MHGTIIIEIYNEQVNSLPLYMDFILQDLLEEKKKDFFLRKKEKYSNDWDKNCKCL